MNKHKVQIFGMHCSSCEFLIHKELNKIPGVKSLEVSYKTGILEIIHDESLDKSLVEEAICRCGYRTGSDNSNSRNLQPSIPRDDTQTVNHFSLTENNLIAWVTALAILIIIYFLFSSLTEIPFFKQALAINIANLSLPLAFVVGLVASVSTCLAVVGSVVMSFSASFRQKSSNPFVPQLIFQAGRLSSFFLFGGILGLIGTSFHYSPTMSAFLNILVAIVITYTALSLLNLVPPMKSLFSSFSPRLGSKLNQLEGEGSHRAGFLIGALTFFLPCGFTQSMQVLALSQADFLKSGLIMLAFALGTLPVLLGVGVLSSSVQTLKNPVLVKVVTVILIFFALFNLNTGLALKGLSFPSFNLFAASNGNKVINETNGIVADGNNIQNGKQIIEMEVNNSGYSPRAFTIKKGIPVEWQVNATALNGCNSTIIVPDLGVDKQLQDGLNVINFTPTKIGKLNFSCGMGMIRGYFEVVEAGQLDIVGVIPQAKIDTKAVQGGSCGGGGCGCGGGQK